MEVRVKDSLALFNSRRLAKNKASGKSNHYKQLNIQRLGMILYGGNLDTAKYKSITVSMHRMITGKATSIRLEFIEKMSDTLGVDPNFIFGYKSKYDKEFNDLNKQ